MRVRGLLVGFLVLASVAGLGASAASAAAAQIPLDRWFGAEAGFYETACYGFTANCPGFSAAGTFGGRIGSEESGALYQDLDGITRAWPARTGNYLYLAEAPGVVPAVATLSSFGSAKGPVPTGAISFAFRVHMLPAQPVVIYRHMGKAPAEVPFISITLWPDGRLTLSDAASAIGVTLPAATQAWHAVTVTYGSQVNSPVKLYLDEQDPVEGRLLLPGPSGDVDFGIVSPTSTPFRIGFDDFVSSPAFDAPIRGARINYLMPLGETSTQWINGYPDKACRDASKNWQIVSEDQRVLQCNLGGSALSTSQNGAVDEYLTEGIPSKHIPSELYKRDLSLQPGPNDPILGVRLRLKAKTDSAPLALSPGYVDAGVLTQEGIVFDNGGTGTAPTRWGATHPTRSNGSSWTRDALGNLRLRLDSGPGLGVPVLRTVFQVRLDYVWVP